MLGVSRSGYYKHLEIERKGTERNSKFHKAIHYVSSVHSKHSSHGYRWVAAYIRLHIDASISDGTVYKVFRYLDLKSMTKHQKHSKPRKIKDKYPNLIMDNWDTVDRPRQVIVSDMTVFNAGDHYYELTLYFDVFTKQILSWRLSQNVGTESHICMV
ncbi:MAG: hypothetical protein Q4D71_15340 [Oscillospiraceae bacterium]|nr:hypothetical protein [Oscillospiraceae bacterium]